MNWNVIYSTVYYSYFMYDLIDYLWLPIVVRVENFYNHVMCYIL